MVPNPEFWNQKTFCLITGASRGIGKSIAIEFSKKVSPDSVFLLLARSEKALEDTKSEILRIANQPIQVITEAIDLGKPDSSEYFDIITTALTSSGHQANDFQHYILVHNAASVGTQDSTEIPMDNLTQLREYFDFNLLSMILLNSQFMKVFSDSSKQRSIVQISSLVAVQPVKGCVIYGASKAARDMVMRCIAAEEPSISTISYAPGLVDTKLYDHVRRNNANQEIRTWMTEVTETEEFLTPVETVTKLIEALEGRKYVKGEHVDWSDIL